MELSVFAIRFFQQSCFVGNTVANAMRQTVGYMSLYGADITKYEVQTEAATVMINYNKFRSCIAETDQ